MYASFDCRPRIVNYYNYASLHCINNMKISRFESKFLINASVEFFFLFRPKERKSECGKGLKNEEFCIFVMKRNCVLNLR